MPVKFQAKLAVITAETSTAETGDYRLDATSAAVDAVIEQANERAASRPSKTIDWAGDIYVKTLAGRGMRAGTGRCRCGVKCTYLTVLHHLSDFDSKDHAALGC